MSERPLTPKGTLSHAFSLIARIAEGCRLDQERIAALEVRVSDLEANQPADAGSAG